MKNSNQAKNISQFTKTTLQMKNYYSGKKYFRLKFTEKMKIFKNTHSSDEQYYQVFKYSLFRYNSKHQDIHEIFLYYRYNEI